MNRPKFAKARTPRSVSGAEPQHWPRSFKSGKYSGKFKENDLAIVSSKFYSGDQRFKAWLGQTVRIIGWRRVGSEHGQSEYRVYDPWTKKTRWIWADALQKVSGNPAGTHLVDNARTNWGIMPFGSEGVMIGRTDGKPLKYISSNFPGNKTASVKNPRRTRRSKPNLAPVLGIAALATILYFAMKNQ